MKRVNNFFAKVGVIAVGIFSVLVDTIFSVAVGAVVGVAIAILLPIISVILTVGLVKQSLKGIK
ncbi:MAG: hypothetical protein ACXW1D_00785 [Halobacteriota archaeon]